MKLLFQGDLHHRDSTPMNRVDNYYEKQFDKLNQLVRWANQYEAPLLLGGDIFDSPRVSAETVNRVNLTLAQAEHGVFACLGQHDVLYHNIDLLKSPVYSLLSSKAIEYVGIDEKKYYLQMYEAGAVCLNFLSWGQGERVPTEGHFNVFLAHVSVFKEIPHYWKGTAYTPDSLRKAYPGFDLYLCGDIHDPLVDGNVVVSGSMMRSSINQRDYRPRAYLIDTETMKIEPMFYEIEAEVFVETQQKTEVSTVDMENLMQAMKNSAFSKDNFKRDCFNMAKENEEITKMMEDIFDGVE